MAVAVEMLGTPLPRAQVAEAAVNVTGSSGTKLALARHQRHGAFPFLTRKYKTKQQHSVGQHLNTFNTNQRTKREKNTARTSHRRQRSVQVEQWSSGSLFPARCCGRSRLVPHTGGSVLAVGSFPRVSCLLLCDLGGFAANMSVTVSASEK